MALTPQGQKFIDRLEKNRMSPKEMYDASQRISKKIKLEEGVPIFGNGIAGNFAGGTASSLLRGFGGMADFVGANNVADAFNKGADYFDERLPEAMPAELSLNYITNPAGLARATGNAAGSIASIALPSFLIPGGVFATGARGLSALARGKIGLDSAKLGLRGLSTSIPESMMEGGNFYRNAVMEGMNPEEARKRSYGVFSRNLPFLMASNTAQWAALPKLFGKGTGLKGRASAGVGELLAQAFEEGEQEGFYNTMMGKPSSLNPIDWYTNPKYKEQEQATYEGVAGFAVPVLGGVGVGVIRDRRAKNKEKKQYEQIEPKLHDWAKEISGNSKADSDIDLIISNAKKLNYSPEETKLALAVATAESNISQGSTSEKGAIGVMQLMPETAKSLGVNPHNKNENIYGGLKYLKHQLDRFGGDFDKALAAYNAGPGAVEKYGGVPPYGETKRYVARIKGFLESAPKYNGENYSYKKTQPDLESIFGVESYNMSTQSGMISRVDKLKPGWEKVIPQIGGVLKNKFGVNPVISSAARTPSHNASVNGAKNSYHLIRENGGDALDIVFDGTNEQKNQIENYFKQSGLFKEVLYHDAGSGYHLHLGGLNTDALADAKSQKVGSSGKSANDPNFTERQNEMWRLAQYASKRAKSKYGYSVPAKFIYKQWSHEAGADFNANKTLASVHNFGGLTQTTPNDLPQSDGSNYYRKFNNNQEFADAYIDDFIKHYKEIDGVKTEREFASVLKKYDYFGDSLENYVSGMESIKVPNTTEEDSDIAAEESEELEGENTSFVDSVIESLLGKNVEPNFNIDRADTALAKAVYKEFAFRKRFDEEGYPREENKQFFEENNLFDNDGVYKPTPINNRILENHFGKQEIDDFGQKHVAERLADIKNIQTPNSDFIDDEYFSKKSGITIFESKLADELSKEDADEISKIAYEYGGRPNKKGNIFSFEDADSRAAFKQEVSNILREKKEIPPVEETQSLFGEIPPLIESFPPLNVKDFDEFEKAVDEGTVDILDDKWKNNSVVANYFKDFVEQKLKDPNAKYREELERTIKDGKFNDTPAGRQLVSYHEEFSSFVNDEFNRQYEERQRLQEQAAQEQLQNNVNTLQNNLQELQTKTDAAQAKLQEAMDKKDATAIKKYGAELEALGEETRNTYAQLEQFNIPPAENIPPADISEYQDLQEQPAQVQLQNKIDTLQNTLEELQEERAAVKSNLTAAINENNIAAAKNYESDFATLGDEIYNTELEISNIKSQLWQLQQPAPPAETLSQENISTPPVETLPQENISVPPVETLSQENISVPPVETETPNQELTQEEIDELFNSVTEGLSQEEVNKLLAIENISPAETLPQENKLTPPPVEIKPSKKIQGLNGNTSTITNDDGDEYNFKYRVVEAKDLIPSHKIFENYPVENKEYPQELQPRDREERKAMMLQTVQMVNNLRPKDLLDNRSVNLGAPVIRDDSVVLNGNGRSMALVKAYEIGKAENYRQTIIDNAEKFGFNRSEIEQMQQPILVREITDSLNQKALQKLISSQAGGAQMSASEKAKSDGKKISNAAFEILEDSEDIAEIFDFTLDKNRRFVARVLNDIINKNEINAYTQNNGQINSDGIKRVKNALRALAYQDDDLIAKLAESTDDNIKNLATALTNVSPTMAYLQHRMNKGQLYSYDIGKQISAAVKKADALRSKKLKLEQYLSQTTMFDHDSAEMLEILKFFDKNKAKPKKVSQFLKAISQEIEKQGAPDDGTGFDFGEEYKKQQASLLDIIKTAKEIVGDISEDAESKTGQQTLDFSQEAKKTETPNTNFESFKENVKLMPEQLKALEKTMREPVTHNGETMTRQEFIEKIARGEIEKPEGKISAGENIYLDFLRGRKNPPVQNDSLKETESGGVHFILGEQENTKTGKLMPSAELSEKVSNEDFVRLNELAKRRGGAYSKVAQKFLFKTAKGRDSFVEEASRDILKIAPAEISANAQKSTPPKTETAAPAETKQPAKRKPTGIFGTYENAVKELKDAFGVVDEEKTTAPAKTAQSSQSKKSTSAKTSEKNNAATSTNKKSRVIPKDKFVNVIDDSDEALKRYFDELEKALNKTSSTPMFNPEVWTAGIKIGLVYIQRGINNFADWAKQITDTATKLKSKEFADKLKVWQPAIFEMLETMPQIKKFNDKQITSIAKTVGTLYDNGTTDFEEIRADFIKNIGGENTNKIELMIKATYNGVKKFFETLDAENKKAANEGEEKSGAEMFNDGDVIAYDKLDQDIKAGKLDDLFDRYEIKTNKKGELISVRERTAEERATENSAETKKAANEGEQDTPILDMRPTNISADAVTALNDPKINDSNGVNSRSGYAEENVSSENITQTAENNNADEDAEFLKYAFERLRMTLAPFSIEKFDSSDDSTKESMLANELDRFEKIYAAFKKARTQYRYYIDYLSPDAAISEYERPEARALADKYGELSSSIRNNFERVQDTILEYMEHMKDINPELRNRYKKVMLDYAYFDGIFGGEKTVAEVSNKVKEIAKENKVSKERENAVIDIVESNAISPRDLFEALPEMFFGTEKEFNQHIQNFKKLIQKSEKQKEIDTAPESKRNSAETNEQVANPVETKKAAVKVTGDEFGEYADIKELRKKAVDYYSKNLQGTSVENTVLGKIDIDENGIVNFTGSGNRELKNSSAKIHKLLLVKHLPELIRDATNIESKDSSKERHKGDYFYYLHTEAVIDNKKLPVDITVVKRNNRDMQYYNHVLPTEEKAKDAVVSTEPESSNEALGTPSIPASSKENISQSAENDNAEIENNKGVVKNESSELGQSGRLADGHQVEQPEVRAATAEEGQEKRNSGTENISGQQRQPLQQSEGADTGTNAESQRPLRENGTGGEGARISTGNGVRGSAGTVHAATDAAERGGSAGNTRVSSNVEKVEFSGHNFRINEESGVGKGSPKDKFKQNIAAIKLLRQLENEERLATPEEQKTLAQFNGWGTLKDVFGNEKGWEKEHAQLKEILTDEEYDAAFNAITNSFYTPVDVAKTMWEGLQRLGFNGGRILDPSMGTGIFFGTMPAEIANNSSIVGIEKDNLTARIAKQLYQNANDISATGFEERVLPKNYFDVAISNVPFNSNVQILSDPEYKAQKYKLHDFFFAKAMDRVRPGGLVIFITSTDTMESGTSQKLRNAIAEQTDLIAAYKLPNTTFSKSSNTKALSDILILQKRLDPLKPSKYAQEWLSDDTIDAKDASLNVNEYFAKHPENIIGEVVRSGFYGNLDVEGKGHNVAKELAALMAKLPKNIFQPVQVQQKSTLKNTIKKISNSEPKSFEFVEKDGEIYQNEVNPKTRQVTLNEVPKENWETIKSYLPLVKSVNNILSAQLLPETTDGELEELRKTLHKNYDNFTKKHGYINSKKNQDILGSDPYYGRTAAIEKYTVNKDKTNLRKTTVTVTEGDIFSKRTAGAIQEPAPTDSASDALNITLAQKGTFDIENIQSLTGKTESEIVQELGYRIFKNPETNLQELAEDYLSGNVREKLILAKEAAKANPEFKRNVEALKKIQPRDLTEKEFATFLGSSWIDNSYYEQFARRLTGGNTVSIAKKQGRFLVLGDTDDVKWSTEWKVEGTTYTLYDFLEYALNRRVMLPKTQGKVDPIKAANCRAKILKLNELFNDWIFSDEERKADLIRHFNINLNNFVAKKYDGSHLTFPQLAPDIKKKLYQHQKDAVWRITQGNNTLLAHCVGAGKTLEMVIAGHELKRLGKCRKPLYVVPQNVVVQFTEDIKAAYNDAKILVLDSENLPLGKKGKTETRKDFEKRQAKRKTTLARIATNDWDFIVISHNMFQRLPMSAEFQKQFYDEQIQILKNQRRQIETAEDGRWGTESAKHSKIKALKEISTAILDLEQKRDEAIAEAKESESYLPFDELGIDQLFVDEADCFKNLVFKTAKQNVAGISTTGSARSWDMYQKTMWLNRQRNGAVVFATGTPVSNTLNEIFTLMRYLIPEQHLRAHGYSNFDEWAGLFSRYIESVELNAGGGGYKLVERAVLTNLQALRQITDVFMDYKAAEDIPQLKRPKVVGGEKEGDFVKVVVKATDTQKKIQESLMARAQAIQDGGVDPSKDNMLKITGEGRKAAIDARLLDPTISESEAGNKITALCDNIFQEYKNTKEKKGTQVVFLDLGVPAKKTKSKKGNKQDEEFNDDDAEEEVEELTAEDFALYDIIKNGLIKRGIPAKEIAFVHDAGNDLKKRQEIFDKFNEGEIRVLLGSTQKMGAGTNFQKHLAITHHLDCPWRPRDIEQRNGRMVRAGNSNEEVKIYVYLTEDTLDAFNWEKIKNKQSMINNFLKGDASITEIEDVSELTLSAAEFVAAASGNNSLMRERATLEQKLQNLKLQQSVYAQNQKKYQEQKQKLKTDIPLIENKIQQTQLDIKDRIKVESGDAFRMKIGNTVYKKSTDAKAALDSLMKGFENTSPTKIGEIGGFDITARAVAAYTTQGANANSTGYRVVLQLKNHGSYTVNAEKDPIRAMANFINKGIESGLTDAQNLLANDKKNLSDIERLLEEPFAQQDELTETELNLKELDNRIAQASKEKGKNTSRGRLSNAVIDNLDDKTATESDRLFEKVKNALGIDLTESDDSKEYAVSFLDKDANNLILWNTKNLNDAITCARYLMKNHSDVLKTAQGNLKVGVSDKGKAAFSIDAEGNEKTYSDSAQKAIENIVAEKNSAPTETKKAAYDGTFTAQAENNSKENDNAKNIANAAVKAATNWTNRHVIIAGTPEADSNETKKIQNGLKEEIIERKATDGALSEVDRTQRESLKKLDAAAENLDEHYKKSVRGEVPTEIKKILDAKKLNAQQAAISEFSASLGVPVNFFKGDERFHGAFRNGEIYINADAENSHDWTFWHESFHWLAAKNPALFKEIADAVNISPKQISAYKTEIGREELTDAEAVEEILADNMKNVASRAGLMQQIGKKNKSLVERLISWLKSVLDKFTDFFNTPKHGLTREQKNKMYDAFGKMARTITDGNGNAIFRFNSRTKNIELASGEPLPAIKFSARDTTIAPETNNIVAETKKAAFNGAFRENGKLKNPYIARKAFEEKINPLRGTSFVNKATGIVAQIGEKGIGKLVSDKAIEKSVKNGYTEQQHFEAAINIKQLYEDSELAITRPDVYKQADVLSIKYFNCETEVLGEKAIAQIMAKETLRHGHKIYTLELQELNKPAELKTRNGTESPAGSKGSAQTSPSTVSRSSEEPSVESIQQTKDDGNIKFSVRDIENEDQRTDRKYFEAIRNFQNAKSDSEKQVAYEKLQEMVQNSAKKAGFESAVPEQTVAYKVRTKAAPKKTLKVYKIFTVANDGSPTALFVGGTEKLPQNVWLDAQDAYHFTAKNGLKYVPSTQNPFTKGGKTGASVEIPNETIRQELIERGFLTKESKASKVTALAYRPGWHAGTLPFFPQGGMKPPKGMNSVYENIHRYNQVVFECELAAEKDYTAEAEKQPKARNKDGSLNTRKADLQYLPENGFYYYATNPMTHGHPELGMWAISGSLKINRALTQEECDEILKRHNMLPQEWEQGKLNLEDLGYTGEQYDAARKTLAPITYDDNSNIIPLSQRFDAEKDDIRFSINNNSSRSLSQKIRNILPSWDGRQTENEDYRKTITRKLKELTGYKIAYGHYIGKDAAFVDDLQKVIRSKKRYDFENVLPKVGQVLAKNLNLPASEEMHNYIASWMLDGAPNNTSAEAKAFQKAMRDNPATFEILQEIQSTFQEINEMSPMERTSRKIKNSAPKEKSIIEEILSGEKYADLVDDLNPVKQLVDEIEKRRGEKLSISENTYELARLFKGTGGISEMMVEGKADRIEEVRAALGKAFPTLSFDNFKPLAAIIDSAGGTENFEEFQTYCVACQNKDFYRIKDLTAKKIDKLQREIRLLSKNVAKNKAAIQDKKEKIAKLEKTAANFNYDTIMTNEECDNIIKNYSAKYGAAQKDIVNFSRTLLQMMVASGVTSVDEYNKMLKAYPNYVPMHRVFDDNEKVDYADSMKRRKGSAATVYSPIQTIIRNAYELPKRAGRNIVKSSLANIARCGGFGDLIEEVKDPKPGDKTIITFYENGVAKYLQTAPEVVEAVETLQGVPQSTWIVKILTAATGAMRGLYTAFSPDFAAGNVFRDIPDAYLHNKYGDINPLTTLLATWKGLMSAIHKDKIFYEWLAMCGAQATLVSPDRDYTQSSVDKITKTQKERWLKSGVKGFFGQVLNALQTVSEYSEYATRIGTYKVSKDALAAKNNGNATLDDMKAAAMMSRDATIDFARAGKSGRTINRYVAFSNAAIQGYDRTYRTFNPAKRKTKEGRRELFGAATRLAISSILPAIIGFVLCHDEDWWRNLPDFQKENNWIFGEGIKIPKGMDFGIRLCSTLTEEFLNWAVDNRPMQLQRMLPRKNDAISKIMPTVFAPIIETSANYSWFMERPIVPAREQILPAHMQYGPYTSDFAKYVGESLDVSPRKVDHLINGYLGFLGKFAFSTVGTSSASFSLDNLPMVRRFTFDPYANPKIVQKYYDTLSEQEKFNNEYRLTGKKPEGFDVQLYERYRKNKKAMQNLSQKEREILNDARLDYDDRKEKLHQLEKIRIKIAERVLK